MQNLKKQKDKNKVTETRKKSTDTVWDMMRRTANDNNPPVLFWFYKVLILSLIIFGGIQVLSLF